MLAKTFLLLASLALASAAPAKREAGRPGCGPKPVAPTLPTHGNGAELPAPAADLVLKYIALGHGIQNYTCVVPNATTHTAVATGALAALYDARPLYPNAGPGSLPSVEAFDALTTNAVWGSPLPLVSDGVTRYGASLDPFPAPADLALPNIAPLKQIGVHFFDNKGVPTFKVGQGILKAAKLNGIKAPASADPGPEETGAVDWLQLGDKGGSKGITAVYRVATAGGVAHKCTTDGASDSVPYAAYYWLYGPKA
ncbi:malate dehydrogenase [Colletotrichum navitas]|uniref:Malate dehydrogenase n=1 Tax=Colletotrichum navitas TaxID=681940 RepID=A0AAD8PYI1_9PEZI|nr:malate dehydrogenase [Colletotrichum navitas]KAK1589884.1 malate dehydrogenase [Colletotrichum navitas]